MKFAVPGMFVPGAILTGMMEPRTGRPVWQMPKPVAYVERLQVVEKIEFIDDKPRRTKVKKMVQFPVYRGMSATVARAMRAQFRRSQRKLKEATLRSHKEGARDMLREFVTTGEIAGVTEDA